LNDTREVHSSSSAAVASASQSVDDSIAVQLRYVIYSLIVTLTVSQHTVTCLENLEIWSCWRIGKMVRAKVRKLKVRQLKLSLLSALG